MVPSGTILFDLGFLGLFFVGLPQAVERDIFVLWRSLGAPAEILWLVPLAFALGATGAVVASATMRALLHNPVFDGAVTASYLTLAAIVVFSYAVGSLGLLVGAPSWLGPALPSLALASALFLRSNLSDET